MPYAPITPYIPISFPEGIVSGWRGENTAEYKARNPKGDQKLDLIDIKLNTLYHLDDPEFPALLKERNELYANTSAPLVLKPQSGVIYSVKAVSPGHARLLLSWEVLRYELSIARNRHNKLRGRSAITQTRLENADIPKPNKYTYLAWASIVKCAPSHGIHALPFFIPAHRAPAKGVNQESLHYLSSNSKAHWQGKEAEQELFILFDRYRMAQASANLAEVQISSIPAHKDVPAAINAGAILPLKNPFNPSTPLDAQWANNPENLISMGIRALALTHGIYLGFNNMRCAIIWAKSYLKAAQHIASHVDTLLYLASLNPFVRQNDKIKSLDFTNLINFKLT